MIRRRLALLASVAWLTTPIATIGVSTPAQAQPCQWRYSAPGNVATATYCGNVVVNGTITPKQVNTPQGFGAACDGATDDAIELQNWLNSGGPNVALYVPPGPGCFSSALLIYDATVHGPTTIYGNGAPASKILAGSSTGGLEVIGSCGAAYDKVYINGLSFTPASGGAAAYGVEMNGVGAGALTNVGFNTNPGSTFSVDIKGYGFQQSQITGGYSSTSTQWIALDDCPIGVNGVGSNGIYIGGGATINGFNASPPGASASPAITVHGGASDVWIDKLHATNFVNLLVFNQNLSEGNGPATLTDTHSELMTGPSLVVTTGSLNVMGLNSYDAASATVASGALLYLANSLLDGTVVYSSGSQGTIHDSTLFGAVTIPACTSSGSILEYNNQGTFGAANSAPCFAAGASVPFSAGVSTFSVGANTANKGPITVNGTFDAHAYSVFEGNSNASHAPVHWTGTDSVNWNSCMGFDANGNFEFLTGCFTGTGGTQQFGVSSSAVITIGGTAGVTCPTGSPTSSFATKGGVVIHC